MWHYRRPKHKNIEWVHSLGHIPSRHQFSVGHNAGIVSALSCALNMLTVLSVSTDVLWGCCDRTCNAWLDYPHLQPAVKASQLLRTLKPLAVVTFTPHWPPTHIICPEMFGCNDLNGRWSFQIVVLFKRKRNWSDGFMRVSAALCT